MKSDKIIISNTGDNFKMALESVEAYSSNAGLGRKSSMHLRLLSEETMSMVKSFSGEFTAYFWVESHRRLHTINLDGKIKLDSLEREKLLATAKSGGNILAKGIMGKIKNIIEIGSLSYKEMGKDTILDYGIVFPTDPDAVVSPGVALGMTEQFWSLQSYKANMAQAGNVPDEPEEVREALDELERSIVSKLASDVQVGILDGKIKLVVSYEEKD